MQKIQESANGGNAHAQGDYSYAEGGAAGDSAKGPGGDGGHAHAIGANSTAIGGRGGRGGIGKGGSGGDAVALHPGEIQYGGNGGESSQHDGRGGRGGTPPMLEIFGNAEFARRATMKLPYGAPNIFPGRGGDTPDTPHYKARRLIVEQIKSKYFIQHAIPTERTVPFGSNTFTMPVEWQQVLTAKNSDVWYDREIVPLSWLNARLQEEGHTWQVTIEAEEYVFVER